MVKEGEAECPVCGGTGKMSIVSFVGVEKRNVRVTCTACEGRGTIPFVDSTVTVAKAAPLETVEDMGEMGDGWRSSKEWVKAHYFLDRQSLCGNIRSQRAILSSAGVDDVPQEEKCVLCARKVAELVKKDA